MLPLEETFGTDRPVVGMVHLQALPGSPGYDSREAVRRRALEDARELAEAGFDGLLVENYGDFPAYPEDVPKHTVAEMAAVTQRIRGDVDLPVGINVLRNDPIAALSVAGATDAPFVRVNVHDGVAVTDQGVIDGRAHETIRYRGQIDAEDVAVLADAQVKHAERRRDRDLATEIGDLVERGRADGIVVTGPATGEATPLDHVRRARTIVDGLDSEPPLFVGSGVDVENVADTMEVADGAIVGTSIKADGVTDAPVDPDRARALLDAADEVR